MRIQAVSAFNNIFKTKASAHTGVSKNIPYDNSNSYKLPNYEVSFGASRAPIVHSSYTLDIDTKEEIEEAVKRIAADMTIHEDNEEENLRMDMLVKKFRDDKDALKYIFECSDIDNTPGGASFAVAYLFALKDNKDEEEWQKGEWNEFLTDLLCNSKNKTGKTLPQIFATNAPALEGIFDAIDNHPVILYKVLTYTDENCFTVPDMAALGESERACKFLNKKLYYLAGQDKSIHRDYAIYLLEANSAVLDEANRALLQSLSNGEF